MSAGEHEPVDPANAASDDPADQLRVILQRLDDVHDDFPVDSPVRLELQAAEHHLENVARALDKLHPEEVREDA